MKKIALISILFVSFALISTSFAQEDVLSGKWSVNTSTAGYTLDKNTGDRTVTIQVNFDKPFDTKPDVILGVTMLDAAAQENIRYNVAPMSVSRDGFVVKIATWAGAKIFAISGYWLAHAKQVATEEESDY